MIVVKLKREKMEKMGKKETIIFRGGLGWGFGVSLLRHRLLEGREELGIGWIR